MMLVQPVWLLFFFPLAALCWWAYRRRTALFCLRAAAVFATLLVFANPRYLLPNQEGTLVVICDRSASMPPDSDEQQHEWLRLIHEQRPAQRTKLALVGFDAQAFTEGFAEDQTPAFTTVLGGDGSNLDAALNLAGNLISPDSSGRVLVLSDGLWTGKSPENAARRLAARGIAVDVAHQGLQQNDPVAIQRLDAPNSLGPGEGFMIHAWIKASQAQMVRYRLTRDGQVIASGEQGLSRGTNRLLLRDLAPDDGHHRYQLMLTPEGPDARPENNTATFLLAVEAPKPLLLVTHEPDGVLARSLRESGLPLDALSPTRLNPSLARLSGYAAVILENVSADELGDPLSALLAAWVRDSGGGLLMLGGKNAYGVGGYYRSPLDPVLPVSMELRKEQRKHQMAMVITLDRSGSMGATVGGGRTKMDLANLASAEVVGLLSGVDMYGHWAVDSEAHMVLSLQAVKNKRKIKRRIMSVESGGGGIYVYEALVNASRMILSADRNIRHIILFADAADAEQPGDVKNLLAKLRAANVTVSVVALGTEQDADADLLKEIATLGGGRVYFTHDAGSLPRIFAQDTFLVARSSFVEEPTATKFTPLMQSLSTRDWQEAPQLGGYNLTYVRDEAQIALMSQDDNRAPLLAWWYAGNGRVMAFTGEAAGTFTGDLARWPLYGDFFASLARWVGGTGQSLPGNSVVTTRWQDGMFSARIHLDPNRTRDPFDRQPGLVVLRGEPGGRPKSETLRFHWDTPHELIAETTMNGSETVLPTIAFGSRESRQLAPVRLPYSPEFAPADDDKGLRGLQDLARVAGGREWLSPSGIWDGVPLGQGYLDLRPYVCLLLMLLFVLEVAERRLGWFDMVRRYLVSEKGTRTVEGEEMVPRSTGNESPARTAGTRGNGRNHQNPPPGPKTNPPTPIPTKPESAGLADALKRAKQTAGKRTGGDPSSR
ncbi:VWA domain-containing protein [Acanthopleuribacter pedis]|uniref:VWA domain-containing protein n=1 Tax=Acanthopleuribacter pedis TaxID=442870 RepID=A0A8J7QLH4_9BACT|nr:VWA domain-containing protein [Acanthopleuribacter pedis]MBO1320483.1 VWA domain-containing protein [Acanthopleuribacter pedis]